MQVIQAPTFLQRGVARETISMGTGDPDPFCQQLVYCACINGRHRVTIIKSPEDLKVVNAWWRDDSGSTFANCDALGA